MIAWGSGFSIGGNALVWTPVNGAPSIVLSDSGGRYFWDQSNAQINASLPPAITPGAWYVQVRDDCIVPNRSAAGDGQLSGLLTPIIETTCGG